MTVIANPIPSGNEDRTALTEKPAFANSSTQKPIGFENFKTHWHDEAIWWAKTAPILFKLMESAGYSPEHLHRYLKFYHDKVLGALGPQPQKFLSGISATGLPLEFSINYQEKGGNPVVRIGVEPININSGTAKDPFNQKAAVDFAKSFTSENGFNDALFNYYATEHTLSDQEKAMLCDAPVERVLNSQLAFGIDLKGGDVSFKGYSFPSLKSRVAKKDIGDLIGESIRKFQDTRECSAAFANVNDFMNEINAYNDLTFFSWDFTEPSKSRLKLYGVSDDVRWSTVERIWNLNGRNQRPSDIRGLIHLRKLWDLLGIKERDSKFNLDFDDDFTQARKEIPMCWNYEMKPGDPSPNTKFYFPVHGQNDLGNVTALAQYFKILGWKELSTAYPVTVQSMFPERDLSRTSRLLSWISFSYTENTGVYLTIYYHSSLDYEWSE